MSLSKSEALALANAQLASVGNEVSVVIIESETLEYDFGWIFFYSSQKYLETKDLRYALGGNAPLIVDRTSGQVITTGTALPIEEYVASYRKWGNSNAEPTNRVRVSANGTGYESRQVMKLLRDHCGFDMKSAKLANAELLSTQSAEFVADSIAHADALASGLKYYGLRAEQIYE